MFSCERLDIVATICIRCCIGWCCRIAGGGGEGAAAGTAVASAAVAADGGGDTGTSARHVVASTRGRVVAAVAIGGGCGQSAAHALATTGARAVSAAVESRVSEDRRLALGSFTTGAAATTMFEHVGVIGATIDGCLWKLVFAENLTTWAAIVGLVLMRRFEIDFPSMLWAVATARSCTGPRRSACAMVSGTAERGPWLPLTVVNACADGLSTGGCWRIAAASRERGGSPVTAVSQGLVESSRRDLLCVGGGVSRPEGADITNCGDQRGVLDLVQTTSGDEWADDAGKRASRSDSS